MVAEEPDTHRDGLAGAGAGAAAARYLRNRAVGLPALAGEIDNDRTGTTADTPGSARLHFEVKFLGPEDVTPTTGKRSVRDLSTAAFSDASTSQARPSSAPRKVSAGPRPVRPQANKESQASRESFEGALTERSFASERTSASSPPRGKRLDGHEQRGSACRPLSAGSGPSHERGARCLEKLKACFKALHEELRLLGGSLTGLESWAQVWKGTGKELPDMEAILRRYNLVSEAELKAAGSLTELEGAFRQLEASRKLPASAIKQQVQESFIAQAVESRTAELRTEAVQLRSNCEVSSRQSQELKALVDDLQEQVISQRRQIQSMRSEQLGHVEDVQKHRLSDLEVQLANQQQILEEAVRKARVEGERLAQEAAEASRVDLLENLRLAEQQVAGHERHGTELGEQLNSKRQEAATLKARTAAQIQELELEVAKSTDEANAASRELAHHRDENKALHAELERHRAETNAELLELAARMETQEDAAAKALDEARVEHQQHMQAHSLEMEQSLRLEEQLVAVHEARNSELSEQLNARRQDIATLKVKLSDHRDETQEMLNQACSWITKEARVDNDRCLRALEEHSASLVEQARVASRAEQTEQTAQLEGAVLEVSRKAEAAQLEREQAEQRLQSFYLSRLQAQEVDAAERSSRALELVQKTSRAELQEVTAAMGAQHRVLLERHELEQARLADQRAATQEMMSRACSWVMQEAQVDNDRCLRALEEHSACLVEQAKEAFRAEQRAELELHECDAARQVEEAREEGALQLAQASQRLHAEYLAQLMVKDTVAAEEGKRARAELQRVHQESSQELSAATADVEAQRTICKELNEQLQAEKQKAGTELQATWEERRALEIALEQQRAEAERAAQAAAGRQSELEAQLAEQGKQAVEAARAAAQERAGLVEANERRCSQLQQEMSARQHELQVLVEQDHGEVLTLSRELQKQLTEKLQLQEAHQAVGEELRVELKEHKGQVAAAASQAQEAAARSMKLEGHIHALRGEAEHAAQQSRDEIAEHSRAFSAELGSLRTELGIAYSRVVTAEALAEAEDAACRRLRTELDQSREEASESSSELLKALSQHELGAEAAARRAKDSLREVKQAEEAAARELHSKLEQTRAEAAASAEELQALTRRLSEEERSAEAASRRARQELADLGKAHEAASEERSALSRQLVGQESNAEAARSRAQAELVELSKAEEACIRQLRGLHEQTRQEAAAAAESASGERLALLRKLSEQEADAEASQKRAGAELVGLSEANGATVRALHAELQESRVQADAAEQRARQGLQAEDAAARAVHKELEETRRKADTVEQRAKQEFRELSEAKEVSVRELSTQLEKTRCEAAANAERASQEHRVLSQQLAAHEASAEKAQKQLSECAQAEEASRSGLLLQVEQKQTEVLNAGLRLQQLQEQLESQEARANCAKWELTALEKVRSAETGNLRAELGEQQARAEAAEAAVLQLEESLAAHRGAARSADEERAELAEALAASQRWGAGLVSEASEHRDAMEAVAGQRARDADAAESAVAALQAQLLREREAAEAARALVLQELSEREVQLRRECEAATARAVGAAQDLAEREAWLSQRHQEVEVAAANAMQQLLRVKADFADGERNASREAYLAVQRQEELEALASRLSEEVASAKQREEELHREAARACNTEVTSLRGALAAAHGEVIIHEEQERMAASSAAEARASEMCEVQALQTARQQLQRSCEAEVLAEAEVARLRSSGRAELLECSERLEASEAQRWGLEAKVEACMMKMDPSMGDPLRGVSVHHLRSTFMDRVTGAGLSAASTVHEVELVVCLPRLAPVQCPRDGRPGAAYVDSICGQDNAGLATHLLSHSWDHSIGDVVEALQEFCHSDGLDPRRTYVWVSFLCTNWARIRAREARGEWTTYQEFSSELADRVQGIGKVLSLVGPWQAPRCLTRLWCVGELCSALSLRSEASGASMLLPPDDFQQLRSELKACNAAAIVKAWQAIQRFDLRAADAYSPQDREHLLRQIGEDQGLKNASGAVSRHLLLWFAGLLGHTLQELVARGEVSGEQAARLCDCAGWLLRDVSLYDLALELLQDGLTLSLQAAAGALASSSSPPSRAEIAEAVSQKNVAQLMDWISQRLGECETPSMASLLLNLGIVRGGRGDARGAVSAFRRARKIRQSTGTLLESPAGATLLRHLGHALDRLGDSEGARAAFVQAQEVREAAGAFDSAARLQMEEAKKQLADHSTANTFSSVSRASTGGVFFDGSISTRCSESPLY